MTGYSNLVRENGLSDNGFQERDAFRERFNGLLDHVARVVVTSRQNIRLALLGLFAQGHILLEDLPGVGKTLLAKTIASSVEGEFSRIQFTPDLLPSDITGTSVFDMGKQDFRFIPGPIFANVVVADELNRTGPRTQSALLEAMAEGAGQCRRHGLALASTLLHHRDPEPGGNARHFSITQLSA